MLKLLRTRRVAVRLLSALQLAFVVAVPAFVSGPGAAYAAVGDNCDRAGEAAHGWLR